MYFLTRVSHTVDRVAPVLGYTGVLVVSCYTGFALAETPANWGWNWSTLALPHQSQQS